MPAIAEKILAFNASLKFTGKLPKGIGIMNPFSEPEIISITSKFYRKFYSDNKPRAMILGINPGRHGAGVTGIPFTDTKRLSEFCGMKIDGFQSHEPSSVFVYDVINAFGGVDKFYSKFYINSVCPLGFTRISDTGKEINYNYYDSKELFEAARAFIASSIKKQLAFGFQRDVCFCMGNNANYKHLSMINEEEKLFDKIVPLEHPRFVIQYRLRRKDEFVNKYIEALKSVSF